MKQQRLNSLLALILLLLLFSATLIVMAQSSAGFNLDWHVIGSGGTQSKAANYQVEGTFGQSFANSDPVRSAEFGVSSGYWVFDGKTAVYLPLVVNQ